MLTIEERERLRYQLVAAAEADHRTTGAALTRSAAAGTLVHSMEPDELARALRAAGAVLLLTEVDHVTLRSLSD